MLSKPLEEAFSLKIHWPMIKAIVPCYGHYGGNATKVILANTKELNGQTREIIIDKNIKTVKKKLAEHFFVDEEAAARRFGKLVGRMNSVPIAYHQDFLLIPFKMRKPKVSTDGASGYINWHQVDSWQEEWEGPSSPGEGSYRSRIIFKDGSFIGVLNTPRSVNYIINQTKVIAHSFSAFTAAEAAGGYNYPKEHLKSYFPLVLVPLKGHPKLNFQGKLVEKKPDDYYR